MAPARARRLLDLLVDVEAVHRRAEGIALAAVPGAPTGGLRLAGFLANVAAVLDDDPAGDPGRREEPSRPPPAPVPARPDGERRRAAPVPPPARARPREPVLAGLAAVALVLLSTLAPTSDGSSALRTILGSATSTVPAEPPGDRRAPSDRGLGGLPGLPAPAIGGAASSAVASPPRAGDGTKGLLPQGATPGAPSGATEGAHPAGGASGAPPASEAVPGAAPPSTLPAEPAPAPDPAPLPPVPAPPVPAPAVPTPPTPPPPAPPPPPPPPPVPCPPGSPQVTVGDVVLREADSGAPIAGRRPMVIEVTGTLTNPAGAAVVVHHFDVQVEADLGASPVVVPGRSTPLTLAPGGSAEWTVRLPAGPRVAERPAATARMVRWSWLDRDLAAACAV